MAPGPAGGDLSLAVLQALSAKEAILSSEEFPGVGFVEMKAALDRLRSRDMISYEQIEREECVLEAEGEQIAAHGSHEARVFEALRQAVEGLSVQELEKSIGDKNVAKLGQSKAFKEKWISRTKEGKFKTAVSTVSVLAHCCTPGVRIWLTSSEDRFHQRCNPGTGSDYQGDTRAP